MPWIPVLEGWSLSSAPQADWGAVACSADGTVLAAAANDLREAPGENAIFVSTDAGVTWRRTSAPNLPWTALVSSADGRHLTAAAGFPGAPEGIYASADFGQTWQKTSAPDAGWVSIAASADGSKLLAVGLFSENAAQAPLGRLYSSSDAGKNWERANAPDESWRLAAISADGSVLVAAAFGSDLGPEPDLGSIYISLDSGATWTKTSAPEQSWTSLACSADGTRIIAAADEDIFISLDSGVSWREAGLPEGVWWTVVCSADGMDILAAELPSGWLYRSADGGTTWTQEFNLVDYGSSLAISADGTRAVAAGGGYFRWGSFWGSIRVSGAILPAAIREQPQSQVIAEGGEARFAVEAAGTAPTYQWQKNGVNLADEAGRIAGSSTPNLMIQSVSPEDTGSYSVVIRNSISSLSSSPAALELASWTLAESLEGSALSLASSRDGRRLVAAVRPLSGPGFASRIWTSSDGGQVWLPTSAPETNWQSVASSGDGLRLVAASGGPGPIYISPDGGSTWADSGAPGGYSWKDVSSSADGRRLLAVAETSVHGEGGAIYTSTDAGASWRRTADPTAGTDIPNVWQTAASSADGMRLAVAQRGIFVSSDGGETWKQGDAPLAYWNSIACSADGMKLIAAAWWEPLHVSSDGGISWTAAAAPAQMWGQVACSADGNQLIAMPDAGPSWIFVGGGMPPDPAPAYFSSDFGVTWTAAGTPAEYWLSVAISGDGRIAAAGASRRGILLSPQPKNPVELKITRSNAGLVLSWPSGGDEAVLQQSSDLGSRRWSVVQEAVEPGESNTVTLPSSGKNHFFRLYAK